MSAIRLIHQYIKSLSTKYNHNIEACKVHNLIYINLDFLGIGEIDIEQYNAPFIHVRKNMFVTLNGIIKLRQLINQRNKTAFYDLLSIIFYRYEENDLLDNLYELLSKERNSEEIELLLDQIEQCKNLPTRQLAERKINNGLEQNINYILQSPVPIIDEHGNYLFQWKITDKLPVEQNHYDDFIQFSRDFRLMNESSCIYEYIWHSNISLDKDKIIYLNKLFEIIGYLDENKFQSIMNIE